MHISLLIRHWMCSRLKKCWEELNNILEGEKDLEAEGVYKQAKNVWLEAKTIFDADKEEDA